jgi:hypothetical protein
MKERGGTVTAVPNHRADLAKSLPVPKRLTTRKKVLVYLLRFGSVGSKINGKAEDAGEP